MLKTAIHKDELFKEAKVVYRNLLRAALDIEEVEVYEVNRQRIRNSYRMRYTTNHFIDIRTITRIESLPGGYLIHREKKKPLKSIGAYVKKIKQKLEQLCWKD